MKPTLRPFPESKVSSEVPLVPVSGWQPEYKDFPYLYNISNQLAVKFYEEHGLEHPRAAFEVKPWGVPSSCSAVIACAIRWDIAGGEAAASHLGASL